MPQEFNVVRCYSCQVFQVHQVKKDPKWVCKVCNEKQSLKHSYCRGSGVDCRKAVQDFNMKRGKMLEQNSEEEARGTYDARVGGTSSETTMDLENESVLAVNSDSKWTKYT